MDMGGLARVTCGAVFWCAACMHQQLCGTVQGLVLNVCAALCAARLHVRSAASFDEGRFRSRTLHALVAGYEGAWGRGVSTGGQRGGLWSDALNRR